MGKRQWRQSTVQFVKKNVSGTSKLSLSFIACLKSAKCLSLTGLQVLYDNDVFATVKSSWKRDVTNLGPKNVDLKALDGEFSYN
ncbi:unnamed protein product [Debaryomyces fabryi]|nr:unnamed protein product [Debaryomyces fabryi]